MWHEKVVMVIVGIVVGMVELEAIIFLFISATSKKWCASLKRKMLLLCIMKKQLQVLLQWDL